MCNLVVGDNTFNEGCTDNCNIVFFVVMSLFTDTHVKLRINCKDNLRTAIHILLFTVNGNRDSRTHRSLQYKNRIQFCCFFTTDCFDVAPHNDRASRDKRPPTHTITFELKKSAEISLLVPT